MDIARVGGEKGAEKEEDLARAMGGRVAECVSKGGLDGWRREATHKRAPRAMSKAF